MGAGKRVHGQLRVQQDSLSLGGLRGVPLVESQMPGFGWDRLDGQSPFFPSRQLVDAIRPAQFVGDVILDHTQSTPSLDIGYTVAIPGEPRW